MTSKREYFSPEMFSKLANAEADFWWFRARNRLLLWTLKSKVPSFNKFLEIGCGTGFVLEGISKAFPDAALFGSEYFEEGLEYARKRIPSATFTRLDATVMDETERYDVIGAFDVIEHIDRDETVLKNLANALKPNGNLLITVPQHPWLWSQRDEDACHVRRYSRKDLLSKVKQVGLKVEYTTSFVSFLLPLMWLSRLRPSKVLGHDPMEEFRIPNWLNRCLETIMNCEFLLLKIGVRFPIGGSLLLMARKI